MENANYISKFGTHPLLSLLHTPQTVERDDLAPFPPSLALAESGKSTI